jgi:hypothetical protein
MAREVQRVPTLHISVFPGQPGPAMGDRATGRRTTRRAMAPYGPADFTLLGFSGAASSRPRRAGRLAVKRAKEAEGYSGICQVL